MSIVHNAPAVEREEERQHRNVPHDIVDERGLGETAMSRVVTNNEPLTQKKKNLKKGGSMFTYVK